MAVSVSIIIVLLIFIIGLFALEIFLSRRDNRYMGLILPAISFIYSLILLLNLAAFDGASAGETAGRLLAAFLSANLPTLIFLGIYFLCRENIRRRRQLDKMNKQDLG